MRVVAPSRSLVIFRATRLFIAAALALCAGLRASAQTSVEGVEAKFRGCDAAGWCRFTVEGSETLDRVRPDGVLYAPENYAISVLVRDRLNALLSSMIHQHKRIVLRGLREAGDGMYSARVIVNEADVTQDEVLRSLQSEPATAGK